MRQGKDPEQLHFSENFSEKGMSFARTRIFEPSEISLRRWWCHGAKFKGSRSFPRKIKKGGGTCDRHAHFCTLHWKKTLIKAGQYLQRNIVKESHYVISLKFSRKSVETGSSCSYSRRWEAQTTRKCLSELDKNRFQLQLSRNAFSSRPRRLDFPANGIKRRV